VQAYAQGVLEGGAGVHRCAGIRGGQPSIHKGTMQGGVGMHRGVNVRRCGHTPGEERKRGDRFRGTRGHQESAHASRQQRMLEQGAKGGGSMLGAFVAGTWAWSGH